MVLTDVALKKNKVATDGDARTAAMKGMACKSLRLPLSLPTPRRATSMQNTSMRKVEKVCGHLHTLKFYKAQTPSRTSYEQAS